jgi:hypothetical protein
MSVPNGAVRPSGAAAPDGVAYGIGTDAARATGQELRALAAEGPGAGPQPACVPADRRHLVRPVRGDPPLPGAHPDGPDQERSFFDLWLTGFAGRLRFTLTAWR